MRGSTRLDRRPASITPIMVPTPRGAISRPASTTEYPPSVCSHGGSSAAVASSRMPTQKIISRPEAKFASRKMRRGIIGLSPVSVCTTNR